MFARKSSAAVAPEESKPAEAGNISSPVPSSNAADSVPDEAMRRQATLALQRSLAFAQIASLAMRSPLYRHFAIGDLEWLVLPALALGTFAIAEAKAQGGPNHPVAAVLWASVSPEVDARLSANLEAPVRLRPDEWRSGDQLWIVAIIGDQRIATGLLQQLAGSAFQGRPVNIRVSGSDGKVVLRKLDEVFPLKTDEAA